MKHGISIVTVAAVMLAMAAPAMALQIEWAGGATGNWSNDNNWNADDNYGVPIEPDGIKTVLGEYNGAASSPTVTLNTAAKALPVMEIYGGAILNIETGGSLTIEGGDEEFFIYTAGGDAGSQVNLLGGELIFVDGTGFDFAGGLLTPGGSLVTDTTSMAGYTIYTNSVPEPVTMSIMAIGGLGLLLKRKRRA